MELKFWGTGFIFSYYFFETHKLSVWVRRSKNSNVTLFLVIFLLETVKDCFLCCFFFAHV